MHELSIAVGIVDAVVAEAEARGLRAVSSVYVRLGPLSGVDRDALIFSFPMACEGTLLAGARLELEHVPVLVACAACGATFEPESIHALACSRCGAMETKLVRGSELELSAFEAAEEVHT